MNSNYPENDDPFTGIHNPTVYGSRAEMKAMEEEIPFSDPLEKVCGTCRYYDGTFCTIDWNDMDEAYKVTWEYEKSYNDTCDEWEMEDE